MTTLLPGCGRALGSAALLIQDLNSITSWEAGLFDRWRGLTSAINLFALILIIQSMRMLELMAIESDVVLRLKRIDAGAWKFLSDVLIIRKLHAYYRLAFFPSDSKLTSIACRSHVIRGFSHPVFRGRSSTKYTIRSASHLSTESCLPYFRDTTSLIIL
jgi:hypothetical protein